MKALQHRLASILVLLWGGVLLYFYASGRINIYLAEDGVFRIAVLVAGVGMLVLGLFNFLTADTAEDCGHGHDHGHDHDHDHGHGHGHDHDHAPLGNGRPLGVIAATLLLAGPISMAAIFTPDRFTPEAALRKETTLDPTAAPKKFDLAAAAEKRDPGPGSVPPDVGVEGSSGSDQPTRETLTLPQFTIEDLDAMVEKTAEGHYLLEIPELFYAAGDREVRAVLEGLPVESVGQIMPGTLEEGKDLRVYRLFIECCIADARPVSIPVQFAADTERPDLRDLMWVKMVGRMSFPMESGLVVPRMTIDSIEEAPEPESTMLY